MDPHYLHTLDEVAKITGLTARWLADRCRAGKIEHTHIENSRRMTREQIDLLIKSHRRGPNPKDDATKARYLERLAQHQRGPRKADTR